MATGLELKVGADVSGAVAGINKVNDALKKLPKGANQATQTLSNFGRVAQDAPFGLIGIANNIDPLLSSFQSLSKSTGGAIGAFKALASSLAGPAGIAVAVSIVTSAFIKYGPEIEAAVFGTNSFGKSINEAAEGAAKDAIKINILAEALKSGTLSVAQQKKAQDELIKINPSFKKAFEGGALSVGKLDVALQKANEQLLNQIKISAATNILQKEFEKLAATVASGGELSTFEKVVSGIQGAFKTPLAPQIGAIGIEAKKSTIKVVEAQKEIEDFGKRINQVFASIGVSFGSFVDNIDKPKTKIKEQIDILKEYRNALAALNFKETATGADLLREKLDLATKTFQDFLEKGVKPNTAAFQFINAEVQKFIGQLPQIQKIAQEIQTISKLDPTIKLPQVQQKGVSINKADQTSPVVITPEALQRQGQYSLMLDEIAAKLAKQQELVTGISNISNTFIDSFFGALASNQDPFKALADSAKKLVLELAAAVIKALALKAIAAVISGGTSAGLEGLAGGGGGLLNLVLRGDLLTGAIGGDARRRRGF